MARQTSKEQLPVNMNTLIIGGVVFAIIQSGVFTTPAEVKSEVLQIQQDMTEQFVTKEEFYQRLTKIDDKLEDIEKLIRDLYTRDYYKGQPIPPVRGDI